MAELTPEDKKQAKAFIEVHGRQIPLVLPKALAQIAQAIGADPSTWVEQKPIPLDDLAIYGASITNCTTGERIDPASIYKPLTDGGADG